jgi:ElaB/YqjD/DUF883 family membrane-anchored ribosome-binding protein
MPARKTELPEGTDHIINGAMEINGGADIDNGSGGGGGFIGSAGGDGTGGTAAAAPPRPQGGAGAPVAQQLREGADSLKQQASSRVRDLAEDGKSRATGALDDLSRVVAEAADSIDERLGAQYGAYARQAADAVSGFAETVRGKDVDELYDDVRSVVRKSPAVAIGLAAAVGFALVRLVKSGIPKEETDVEFTPDSGVFPPDSGTGATAGQPGGI